MLSLLKKKSEAAAQPAVPAWHPNFRDYDKLPDVKVVRTAFFINGVAIVVLLALAAYFSIHEWQLHILRGQIAEAELQIKQNKRTSDQQVALFKKFQAEAAKIEEVRAFVASKEPVTRTLLRIATTLPENVALNSFDLHEGALVLRLIVRGTPEVAAGYATAYLDQLRADQTLTAFDHARFEFTSQSREGNGRLAVEFTLHLKGAKQR